jgi:hypothetical protein
MLPKRKINRKTSLPGRLVCLVDLLEKNQAQEAVSAPRKKKHQRPPLLRYPPGESPLEWGLLHIR